MATLMTLCIALGLYLCVASFTMATTQGLTSVVKTGIIVGLTLLFVGLIKSPKRNYPVSQQTNNQFQKEYQDWKLLKDSGFNKTLTSVEKDSLIDSMEKMETLGELEKVYIEAQQWSNVEYLKRAYGSNPSWRTLPMETFWKD